MQPPNKVLKIVPETGVESHLSFIGEPSDGKTNVYSQIWTDVSPRQDKIYQTTVLYESGFSDCVFSVEGEETEDKAVWLVLPVPRPPRYLLPFAPPAIE